MSNIKQNTTTLEAILEQINNLPEASWDSGSSSGMASGEYIPSADTLTVTIETGLATAKNILIVAKQTNITGFTSKTLGLFYFNKETGRSFCVATNNGGTASAGYTTQNYSDFDYTLVDGVFNLKSIASGSAPGYVRTFGYDWYAW